MGLMFGTRDEIECIVPTKFAGPEGTQVCLAKKVSLHFFGAGVHVSDGGYVLRVDHGQTYYKLNEANLKELQALGLVPTPLPKYAITPLQYLFGYSLWIVLFIVAVAMIAQRLFGKLRPFLAAPTAAVTGPPIVRTDDDKWLSAELGKHLHQGERLQHQALATNFPPGEVVKNAACFYLGLTDRRIVVLEAMQGIRGAKREIRSARVHARDELVAVGQDELHLQLDFADGQVEHFWIQGSQRKLTNQWLFARDVPRLLLSQPSAAAAAA
jgi:hypothetical protein